MHGYALPARQAIALERYYDHTHWIMEDALAPGAVALRRGAERGPGLANSRTSTFAVPSASATQSLWDDDSASVELPPAPIASLRRPPPWTIDNTDQVSVSEPSLSATPQPTPLAPFVQLSPNLSVSPSELVGCNRISRSARAAQRRQLASSYSAHGSSDNADDVSDEEHELRGSDVSDTYAVEGFGDGVAGMSRESWRVWAGPAGTYTPLHYDAMDNVLFQVRIVLLTFRYTEPSTMPQIPNVSHGSISRLVFLAGRGHKTRAAVAAREGR